MEAPADTIFAVSSGRPPAAIAVIRVSGPNALAAGEAIAGNLPPLRDARLRRLRDAAGATLDNALVVAFNAAHSSTGEDTVELHCHGGRAVIAAVEAALAALAGLRKAEAGEFTRRALLNGRIDLAQAEGLADLIEAETEAQRRTALAAAEGQVSRAVAGWMARLSDLSARVEAQLDFAEEEDVSDNEHELQAIVQDAHQLGGEIGLVVSAPAVDRYRGGIQVVIAGPPNSGKSTLLNLLAERDVAIVSSMSGTTRDRIEAPVVRAGIAYVLTDTAGLTAETVDPVEEIGVALATDSMRTADILIWMSEDPPLRDDALWLHARADLPGRSGLQLGQCLAVSQCWPESVGALWRAIDFQAKALSPRLDQLPVKAQQQQLCNEVAAELDAVQSDDPVILAEHLRCARESLAQMLGVNATEMMLDALFSRFCVGK